MKKFFKYRVALANEQQTHEQCVGLANEFSLDGDGWVKIAPYGRSLKERIARGKDGVVRQEAYEQVLDRPAAEEMVRRFNSLWGRMKRFVTGVPIYREHPDLKEHAPETETAGLSNEKRPYGMFAALEARDDGFYGKPVMTEEGQAAIENDGLKWLSPFWYADIGPEKKGVRIARPFHLISAGLTKYPNIQGGEALANQKDFRRTDAEDAKEETNMERKKLIEALNKTGVALANEATDEQIATAIGGLVPKTSVTALENEKTTLTQARTAAEGLVAAEKTAREKAEKDLGETRTALANERSARIELIVEGAIQSGRITAAEKQLWVSKLSNEFAGNVTALANEAVKVKVKSATDKLGERKAELNKTVDVSTQIVALANERMEKVKCSYEQAYGWVQQNHGALFEPLGTA